MEQINKDVQSKKNQYTVANTVINIYLTIMFGVFPLFLTSQYSHARKDKY